jgi:hypothetical protein
MEWGMDKDLNSLAFSIRQQMVKIKWRDFPLLMQ